MSAKVKFFRKKLRRPSLLFGLVGFYLELWYSSKESGHVQKIIWSGSTLAFLARKANVEPDQIIFSLLTKRRTAGSGSASVDEYED